MSEMDVNWRWEMVNVPEGDDVPAAGDGIFAYSGAKEAAAAADD